MRLIARRLTLAATLMSAIGMGLGGCDGDESVGAPGAQPKPAGERSRTVSLPRGVSAHLPAGWELLRKPINGVIYPAQVFAAASYPVKLGDTAPGCGRVSDQSPPGGVLIQVIQYAGRPNPENFPPRERPFRLPKHAYAVHECAGPSYNIVFRDHRRGLQAFVILDRHRVDPRIRQQAIELLSSLHFDRPEAEDGVSSSTSGRAHNASDPYAPRLLALRDCDFVPGGAKIRVRGVSCKQTRTLVLELHFPADKLRTPTNPGPSPAEDVVYDVGDWRCWARFIESEGVRHACWNGERTILFSFG